MTTPPNLPPVIATIGLHGSASTWVFNVARELVLAAAGAGRVVSCYADTPDQLPPAGERAGKALVVKSHHGSAALDAWLAANNARVLLSVRDPRDACISMAQRFRAPLAHTASWVLNDCAHVARVAERPHTLFRYEDRFFEHREAVASVADALGLAADATTMHAIFDRYRTNAVRDFAAKLADLPQEQITMVGTFRMDKMTQILAPHIGDGASGKWLELPVRRQRELTDLFGPHLDRLGYER